MEPSPSNRPGLGLPPAVVIRSQRALSPIHPTETRNNSDPSRWESYSEWSVNPANHGPERLTRPPIFLPSQLTYDELGRSRDDGFGTEIEIGEESRNRRELEAGNEVAAWYANLASRSASGASTPGAGPSRRRKESPPLIIDLTEDLDNAVEASAMNPQTHFAPNDTQLTSAEAAIIDQPQPIPVHRSEWFIRRALARQAVNSPPIRPVPPSRPSSIGALVDIDPTKAPRVKPAQYVLGPENRGYVMLKDRLGWEGGGLGRPEGWFPPQVAPTEPKLEPELLVRELESELEIGTSSRPADTALESDTVDLTVDSEEEEEQLGEEVDEPQRGGPGRTAPVATALKLDRLGIGHIRNTRKGNVEAAKKVTHTAKEIAEAQRRAKYSGKPKAGLRLGTKGKIKWKERDKRDRESRQRLAAAVNA